MDIKPLGDRILIKPIKEKERTESGIYLPESAREGKKEAEIVALGKDRDGNEIKIPLKVGDKVIYGGYSSDEFEMNGEKYLIIDYKDILAKLENGV